MPSIFLSFVLTGEWAIVAQRKLSKFSAISWQKQVNFQWNDDEVPLVLD